MKYVDEVVIEKLGKSYELNKGKENPEPTQWAKYYLMSVGRVQPKAADILLQVAEGRRHLTEVISDLEELDGDV